MAHIPTWNNWLQQAGTAPFRHGPHIPNCHHPFHLSPCCSPHLPCLPDPQRDVTVLCPCEPLSECKTNHKFGNRKVPVAFSRWESWARIPWRWHRASGQPLHPVLPPDPPLLHSGGNVLMGGTELLSNRTRSRLETGGTKPRCPKGWLYPWKEFHLKSIKQDFLLFLNSLLLYMNRFVYFICYIQYILLIYMHIICIPKF